MEKVNAFTFVGEHLNQKIKILTLLSYALFKLTAKSGPFSFGRYLQTKTVDIEV